MNEYRLTTRVKCKTISDAIKNAYGTVEVVELIEVNSSKIGFN